MTKDNDCYYVNGRMNNDCDYVKGRMTVGDGERSSTKHVAVPPEDIVRVPTLFCRELQNLGVWARISGRTQWTSSR